MFPQTVSASVRFKRKMQLSLFQFFSVFLPTVSASLRDSSKKCKLSLFQFFSMFLQTVSASLRDSSTKFKILFQFFSIFLQLVSSGERFKARNAINLLLLFEIQEGDDDDIAAEVIER